MKNKIALRIAPEAVDTLIEQIPKTLEHAIVIEEGVPMECVTNLQEVVDEVTSKFVSLKVVAMQTID